MTAGARSKGDLGDRGRTGWLLGVGFARSAKLQRASAGGTSRQQGWGVRGDQDPDWLQSWLSLNERMRTTACG